MELLVPRRHRLLLRDRRHPPPTSGALSLIPEITVGGDYSGSMTYDRNSNSWSMNVTAAAAGPAGMTLSTTGKLYNVATGTDDAAAIDTPMYFGIENGVLTFSATPQARSP